MEILRPLANMGKEAVIGLYNEVIVPELALSQQQEEAARMRSKLNQQDLIALMQVEMIEEELQAHMQYPSRLLRRMYDLDPQIEPDIAALGDVRSELAQFTKPAFSETPNSTAMGRETSVLPVSPPQNTAPMGA